MNKVILEFPLFSYRLSNQFHIYFLYLFLITCRLCQQIFFLSHAFIAIKNVSFAWSILWSLGKCIRACCCSQYLHDDYDNKVIIQYFPSFLLCPFLNNKIPRGVLPSIVIFVVVNLKDISASLYILKRTLFDHDWSHYSRHH